MECLILGKDQDITKGASWYIEEVEGGYTIKSAVHGRYLTGAGLSDDPVVWQFVLPTTTSINAVAAEKAEKKAVKALVNGQLVIVKGNDKFNVAGQLVK